MVDISWIQSPNYDQRSRIEYVDTIVVHSTAGGTLESVARWFANPESKVSAHFTIGKDGSIVQSVSTFCRAWHAGVSIDRLGREHVNDFSIGIELVNANDGKDPYPSRQVEVLGFLIKTLCRRFDLKYIVSHEFIAVPKGRKSDPAGFPWNSLDHLGLQISK